MDTLNQHDTIPEVIPVPPKPQKKEPVLEDSSPEYIPQDDERVKTAKPVALPEAEISSESITNPQYILPASENERPSVLFWSITISLVSIIILILIKNSLDWYQRLTQIGIGISLFYLICLMTLLSSVSVSIYRMLRDYIHADDGSELAMIGAKVNAHSDLNTVLDYANTVIAKYEDHPSDAVRNGVQKLRSRMQFTIDKTDLIEEIRKGILIHLDQDAETLISRTAQQTLWGTAISPVAVIDMSIVAWRTIAMVRDIAALYGYRPGFLGSLRLFSRILSTVAFAGLTELAMNATSDLLGNALLRRLSVTLAHALGVGMLTIRVGIAACVNCRPLPFQKGEVSNHLTLLYKGIKDVLLSNFFKKS